MGPDTSLDRTGDMLAAMGSLDIRPSAEAPIRFPMFTIQKNVAIHGEKIRSPYRLLYASTPSKNSLPSRRPNCQLLFVRFRISPLHLSSSSAEPDFPPSYFSGSPPAAAVHHLFFKYEFLNGCHGIRRIGNSLGFQPQG